MASFKDFMKTREAGGVQLGGAGCETRCWDAREPKASELVCATSEPCRCLARATKGPRDGEAPLVSVIVPTTAARAALHEVVYGCFAAQTYPNVELLVLDTGGARPSPFFAACADPRVTYVHERDLALGANGAECVGIRVGIKRNRLVARARGTAVACFDDDNVYAPRYLEVMVAHLRASGAALLTLGAYYTARVDATGGFEGGWLNSNKGPVGNTFLQVRGAVVGRARRSWDKRGETMVFRASVFSRGGARFSEDRSIGEEGRFYRGDDYHPVVDDAGIFVHVDHPRNSGAPLTWDENARALPAHLAAALAAYGPAYRRFREALDDGSVAREIAYEPMVDGWIQKPAAPRDSAAASK